MRKWWSKMEIVWLWKYKTDGAPKANVRVILWLWKTCSGFTRPFGNLVSDVSIITRNFYKLPVEKDFRVWISEWFFWEMASSCFVRMDRIQNYEFYRLLACVWNQPLGEPTTGNPSLGTSPLVSHIHLS